MHESSLCAIASDLPFHSERACNRHLMPMHGITVFHDARAWHQCFPRAASAYKTRFACLHNSLVTCCERVDITWRADERLHFLV
mmetsp:Transcript_36418/g.58347  ORF Transcript_36418/g.58347 Transcript_36418/m.58347 type:complete len:84 (+) Transcript_36418:25-276(+)